MIDLNSVNNSHMNEITSATQWTDAQYRQYFGKYFNHLTDLREKLQDKDVPITDQELEWILTTLPLNLISASEQLANLKTMQEAIKYNIKKNEHDLVVTTMEIEECSETKAKEKVAVKLADDRFLVAAYDSLYERVSRQITFSKELIMSCKKIWDARRNSEQNTMPSVSEADLPEYQEPNKPSTYIK